MRYIFLHGSFHAAWNWHQVLPLLEHAGHEGIAMDLPAHGLNRASACQASLQACVDSLLTIVDAHDQPVILVAHSRNGIVISEAAQQRPEKIKG